MNYLSRFQITDSQIVDFLFWTDSLPDEFSAQGMALYDTFRRCEEQPKEDEIVFQSNLHIALNQFNEEDKDQIELVIRMEIRGLIKTPIPPDDEKEKNEEWARLNAVSLLYSAARTHINSFSRLTSSGPVTLPSIDPRVYMEAAKQKGENQ